MAQANAVALIGDVVGSRRSSDRSALQTKLVAALAKLTEPTGGLLSMTVGDEFQGRFPDLESAMSASLRLHLDLIGVARLRIGIGRGALSFEAETASPVGQDGPVWWRARDSVESVAAEGDQSWTRVDTGTEWDELINAYLTMRDTIVAGLDPIDGVIGLGLLDGVTQKQLAGRLGLNQSSVSRRVSRHGLSALVAASGFRLPFDEEDA